MNLSDVNLEFVDGSSAQRNLSFLLQQPLILRHLGQSFFSLLTGKFHCNVEKIYGKEREEVDVLSELLRQSLSHKITLKWGEKLITKANEING